MNNKKYIGVADFEFTMPMKGQSSEVVSIGTVILDEKGKMVATFDSIVRPSKTNVKISRYCTDLTGITQEMVNKAEPFFIVFKKYTRFLRKYGVKS